jgi:hypothetical protein
VQAIIDQEELDARFAIESEELDQKLFKPCVCVKSDKLSPKSLCLRDIVKNEI